MTQPIYLGKRRLVLVTFVMLLGLLLPSSRHLVAQTPQAATPVASPVVQADAADSFAAFGYDDVTARGMFASTTYTFPLPLATSAPSGGRLDLAYSHSPLLIGDLSTMTVLVNGQSVDSVHLTEDTAESGRLAVDLPPLEGDADAVQVTISFHLRLTREACEIPDDPALWVTIDKASTLTLPTGVGETEVHVADAPSLLRRSAKETGTGPVIVMPDAGRLDAASAVSFQLGQWSGMANSPVSLGDVVTEMPGSDQAAVIIGTGDVLDLGEGWGPLAWDGEQFLLAGEAIPAGHGVLAMRQQPVPQILVSGATPEAVRLAANALSRPMDWPTFDAPVVIVSGDLAEASPSRYAWQEGAASFAQLGGYRQDVIGPGEHFIDLPYQRPANWVLRDGSQLTLDLQVSPAVRAETSWVRVTVNGQDIGTQPLRANQDGVQAYAFDLPADRLNVDLEGQPERDLMVQVRLFLDSSREACESIDPAATWAALLPTSAISLPHDTSGEPDLGRFPAGLTSDDDPAAMTVVVPDDATEEEQQAALQAVAAAGRWNAWSAPVIPDVMTAGEVSSEALQDRAVIVIGGPQRNGAASELGDETLQAIAPAAYAEVDAPYGVLALGDSPWSDGDIALLVAGSDNGSEGILLAATALGDQEVLAGMRGTRVAITGNLGPQTMAGAEPSTSIRSDLSPQVLPDERPWIERIDAWQVVGAIVLVAFLALMIGVIQIRWIRGGKR